VSRRKVQEGIAGALDAWGSTPTPKSTSRLDDSAPKKKKTTNKKAATKRRRTPKKPVDEVLSASKETALRHQPAGFVARAGEPRRRITAYLSPGLAKRLRLYAAGEAVEMSAIIAAALEDYLGSQNA